MTDRPKRQAPSWVARGAVAVAFLVLYPLSVGPVHWLWRKGMMPSPMQHVVEVVYSPVYWLRDNNRAFGEFYFRYLYRYREQ